MKHVCNSPYVVDKIANQENGSCCGRRSVKDVIPESRLAQFYGNFYYDDTRSILTLLFQIQYSYIIIFLTGVARKRICIT